MNYVKTYLSLIRYRRQNPIYKANKKDGSVHYHHIIPKACGGTPTGIPNGIGSNIIGLTRKEHFVAHHLLAKIYQNSKNTTFKKAMNCAFRFMCGQFVKSGALRVSARTYSMAIANAKLVQRGGHLSEHNRLAIKATLNRPEQRARLSRQAKGRKHTAIARQHMKEAQNRPELLEHYRKVRTGKFHTEESKKKMKEYWNRPENKLRRSIESKGRTPSEETKQHLRDIAPEVQAKRKQTLSTWTKEQTEAYQARHKAAMNRPDTRRKLREAYANKTPEEKASIRQKAQNTRAAWTDEQKAACARRTHDQFFGKKLSDHQKEIRKWNTLHRYQTIRLTQLAIIFMACGIDFTVLARLMIPNYRQYEQAKTSAVSCDNMAAT